MIINLNIKIIYLIETYPETAIVSFSQEDALTGKNFSLCHPVHKIEIPYIHKEVLNVLVPVSRNIIQIIYRYFKNPGIIF